MNLDAPLFFGHSVPCDASLGELLAACRDLLRDNSFPTLRLWHERGGKVLGHFQVYLPEEIAHAAGVLPVKLGCSTAWEGGADVHFGSYLCSIIKNSLQQAVSHQLELDLFVTPSICDAARNLAAVWSRNFSYPCRTLYLPQQITAPAAVDYLRAEYAGFARALAELTGELPDSDALNVSIATYNRNRALVRQLYDLKGREPWKLPVDVGYLLTAVGALLPCQEHTRLLETALELLQTRKDAEHDGRIRVLLHGCFCEQPPLEMLEAIARNCHVVDDDLLIGLRWLQGDVVCGADPLESLARAYCEQSAGSPVQHDSRRPGVDLLQQVRRLDARAVILAAPKMCEPGLEELVPIGAALDREGIPACVCEFEQGMTSFDQLELQLETFAENILYADVPGER